MGDMTEPKWGWMRAYAEYADGPYDSREEAVAAAQSGVDENSGDESVIILGHCDFLVPADYVPDDMREVLGLMDEHAHNETSLEQDEVFNARPGAEKALMDAMVAWVREWVTTDAWEFDEVERITLRQGGKP